MKKFLSLKGQAIINEFDEYLIDGKHLARTVQFGKTDEPLFILTPNTKKAPLVGSVIEEMHVFGKDKNIISFSTDSKVYHVRHWIILNWAEDVKKLLE